MKRWSASARAPSARGRRKTADAFLRGPASARQCSRWLSALPGARGFGHVVTGGCCVGAATCDQEGVHQQSVRLEYPGDELWRRPVSSGSCANFGYDNLVGHDLRTSCSGLSWSLRPLRSRRMDHDGEAKRRFTPRVLSAAVAPFVAARRPGRSRSAVIGLDGIDRVSCTDQGGRRTRRGSLMSRSAGAWTPAIRN